MSWLSKSLTGLLQQPDEGIRGREEEEWQAEPSSPGKSMKEDLSELGRSLWGGVASFLAPPPPAQFGDPQEPDELPTEVSDVTSQVHSLDDGCSTPGSPSQKLSGLQNDLAELKGGFAKGLSRLSSVIRVVAGEAEAGKEEQEDGKLKALLKPLIGRVLDDEPSVGGGAEDGDEDVSRSLQARLVSGIDEISKLASSIFPFVQEEDGMDLWEAPGLTDEVVAFARNVSKHPETWLDFPFVPDDEEQNGFEMTSSQKEHIEAIQRAAPRLAALKVELCPEHMTEGHFWKVYFVLLHSRLSQADAAFLSSSQVLEARKVLLEHLESEAHDIDDNVVVPEADVVDKGAIESTIKLSAPQQQEQQQKQQEEEQQQQQQQDQVEEIADEWLGTADDAPAGRRVYDDEEISFSDLEDEGGAAGPSKVQPGDDSNSSSSSKNKSQGGWVQLDKKPDEGTKRHERVASSDWLTVDQEDVART